MVRALVENWRDAIAKDREVTNQVSTVVDVRAENVAAHIVFYVFFRDDSWYCYFYPLDLFFSSRRPRGVATVFDSALCVEITRG